MSYASHQAFQELGELVDELVERVNTAEAKAEEQEERIAALEADNRELKQENVRLGQQIADHGASSPDTAASIAALEAEVARIAQVQHETLVDSAVQGGEIVSGFFPLASRFADAKVVAYNHNKSNQKGGMRGWDGGKVVVKGKFQPHAVMIHHPGQYNSIAYAAFPLSPWVSESDTQIEFHSGIGLGDQGIQSVTSYRVILQRPDGSETAYPNVLVQPENVGRITQVLTVDPEDTLVLQSSVEGSNQYAWATFINPQICILSSSGAGPSSS